MNINEKLINSIQNKDLESVKECLKNGADANAKDNYGWRALEKASYNGYLEIAKILIENGADVNGKALINSALEGNLEIAKLLIDNGADVNYRNDRHNLTPLMATATFNHLETAKLLIEHGADVNARNIDGETAFILAIKEGKVGTPFQKLLIENGADVNIKDHNGFTALDYAKEEIETIKEKVKPNNQKYLKQLQENKKAKTKEADLGMGGM